MATPGYIPTMEDVLRCVEHEIVEAAREEASHDSSGHPYSTAEVEAIAESKRGKLAAALLAFTL